MLGSSLCDYNDLYILIIRTITATKTGTAATLNNRVKKILKICAPFSVSISKTNNT